MAYGNPLRRPGRSRGTGDFYSKKAKDQKREVQWPESPAEQERLALMAKISNRKDGNSIAEMVSKALKRAIGPWREGRGVDKSVSYTAGGAMLGITSTSMKRLCEDPLAIGLMTVRELQHVLSIFDVAMVFVLPEEFDKIKPMLEVLRVGYDSAREKHSIRQANLGLLRAPKVRRSDEGA